MNNEMRRPLFAANNSEGKPVLALYPNAEGDSVCCVDESGVAQWYRLKSLTITNPVPSVNKTLREDSTRKKNIAQFTKGSK